MNISKLFFKGNEYNLGQLIELRRLSPMYKNGDVIDSETGELLDISNIDKWRDLYIDELVTKTEKLKVLDKKDSIKLIKMYEKKYSENRINKRELLELIKFKNSRYLEIDYEDYYIKNADKPKPDSISFTDYGRFNTLLDMMSSSNKVQHRTNGRQIKEVELIKKLDFNNPKTFKNFVYKLSKVGMLAFNGVKDKKFIHINPVYAKRRVKIDQTIYDLFKEDLNEYLDEYEITYFSMTNDDMDEDTISATVELI